MKPQVRYGFFPWWPENGDAWIHPEDVALARRLLPSPRVFRRVDRSDGIALLSYGSLRLRVQPRLWQEIFAVPLEIGDWVEVLSQCGQNTPRTGTIRERLWDRLAKQLTYQIEEAGTPIPNRYRVDELRPVELPDLQRLGGYREPPPEDEL